MQIALGGRISIRVETIMTYIRIIAWDVVFSIIRKVLIWFVILLATAWIGMHAWAIVSRFTEFSTVSYLASVVAIIGLWIVVLPLIILALKFYQPPERDLFS